MRTQQVVFFKGDVGTKVKTPGAGKNESRRALQVPTMEKLCKRHHFPVQGTCLVPNNWGLNSGPHLEPLHQSFLVMGFFQDGVSRNIFPGWLQTVILLISAS
jgi:hypothetical protein